MHFNLCLRSTRLVPGHLSERCPAVAWHGAPGTAVLPSTELQGRPGWASLCDLGAYSQLTSHSGTVCPGGESSVPLPDAEQRENRGPQPPTNQFVIPPSFLGTALQPTWRPVHGGHKLSLSQVTFLSRKLWKPSHWHNSRSFAILPYQVNDIKWRSVTGFEEFFGNIWGQSGKAMRILGFSAALSETDSTGLEKSRIWFSSKIESHPRKTQWIFAGHVLIKRWSGVEQLSHWLIEV